MKLHRIYILLALLGIPFLIWNMPIAIGWIIGHGVMFLLVIARTLFYDNVLNSPEFKMGKYISYVLFTVVLIAGPLLFSFFFREWVEPLAVFAAYFLDRSLTFITNLFSKEKAHAS